MQGIDYVWVVEWAIAIFICVYLCVCMRIVIHSCYTCALFPQSQLGITNMFVVTRWSCWLNRWCGTRFENHASYHPYFIVFGSDNMEPDHRLQFGHVSSWRVGGGHVYPWSQFVVLNNAPPCFIINSGYGLCVGGWVGHGHNYMCIVMCVHAYSYSYMCYTRISSTSPVWITNMFVPIRWPDWLNRWCGTQVKRLPSYHF